MNFCNCRRYAITVVTSSVKICWASNQRNKPLLRCIKRFWRFLKAEVRAQKSKRERTEDMSTFEHLDTKFFPLNMMPIVEPVDVLIGRWFRAAFLRLLVPRVDRIVEFVNKELKKPFEHRKCCNLTQAVTEYDADKRLANAWNLVPLSVSRR